MEIMIGEGSLKWVQFDENKLGCGWWIVLTCVGLITPFNHKVIQFIFSRT